MAKYSGPVCRLCRREGVKLFLKGTRCMSENVPLNGEVILRASMDSHGEDESLNMGSNFGKNKSFVESMGCMSGSFLEHSRQQIAEKGSRGKTY